MLIYKVHNGIGSCHFRNCLCFPVTSQQLQSSRTLCLTEPKNQFKRDRTFLTGSWPWNSIPKEIRKISTLPTLRWYSHPHISFEDLVWCPKGYGFLYKLSWFESNLWIPRLSVLLSDSAVGFWDIYHTWSNKGRGFCFVLFCFVLFGEVGVSNLSNLPISISKGPVIIVFRYCIWIIKSIENSPEEYSVIYSS